MPPLQFVDCLWLLTVSTAIGKSGWVVLFSPGWRPPVFQAGGRVFSRRAGVRWPAGSPQCHVEERDRAFRADAALSDAACGVFDGE